MYNVQILILQIVIFIKHFIKYVIEFKKYKKKKHKGIEMLLNKYVIY